MEDNKEELLKIKHLLHENLQYSKKILELNEKTKKYILTIQIINTIKLVLIIIPIILAIIFLPPLLGQLMENYKEIFSQIGALKSGDIQQLDSSILQDLLP